MEHSYMPVIYICAPYADDPKGNTEKAKKYARFATDSGYIPISPHLLLSFMDEATERRKAMFMDLVLLGKCSELWYFGDRITSGMDIELERARKRRMKIRHFTEDCREVTV